MKIALVTCDGLLPDGDPDDQLLVHALRRRGVEVDICSWNDQTITWKSYDLAVLRSTWDYTTNRKEFLDWLISVPRLANPADVVAANTDKIYLRSIADAGIPVVRTVFVAPGEPVVLPDTGEFVVKPSVGAGSRGAGRFDAARPGDTESAVRHVEELHADGRTVLIQPYLAAVDTVGETGLIYLDGQFSHAVRKARMLAEGARYPADSLALYIEENISPREPSEAELEVGRRVLDHLTPNGSLLYARIDLLPAATGPVLVEAELTEPSLFLSFATDSGGGAAAGRMADAVIDRVGR
jgi:glutathione synthase/RimK-type ligase-like ATP-grasp enzyme